MSLAEAKHRSISRLVLKALQDASISDAEFASIMSEVEQYYDLKAKLRQNNSLNAVEKVDDAALREEIKKKYQWKLGSLLTIAKSWELNSTKDQMVFHCLYADILSKDFQIQHRYDILKSSP